MIGAIWDWANNNEGGLALAVGLGVPVAAFLISFVQNNHLREELSDLSSRDELIARYSLRGQDAYFSGLARAVGLAEWIYGPKALSWRAYGRCQTIALIYPLLAVMLGWVLFNIWNPAWIEIFVDTENGWERALRFAIFNLSAILCAVTLRNYFKVVGYISGQFPKWLRPKDGIAMRNSKAAHIIFHVLAFASILVFAGAFAFAGIITVVGVSATAGALAAAFGFVFVLFNTVSGVFTLIAVIAAAPAGNFLADDWALVLLLYVFLPILNAAADMISLWITHGFLRNFLTHRPNFGWVLTQFLVDLVLAALCLAALIALIIGGLTIWAAINPASVPLDWRVYWADVHADPRTGVALYIMALTTLVPTIIHVFSGLAALFTQKAWMLQPVVAELSEQPATEAFSKASVGRLERKIRRASFLGNLAACIAVAVLFIPPIWVVYALIT